jgi:hypothetical protein
MERLESNGPALAAIRKVVALALPVTGEIRGYWRIWVGYWERSSYDDEVARVMRLRYDEWRGRLERLLVRAQVEGDVSQKVDPRQAAEALIALVDGIGVQVVLGVAHMPAARQKALFDRWLDAVRRGEAAPSLAAPEEFRLAR